MILKLLPILLLLAGTGAGIGAGLVLRSHPDEAETTADMSAGPTEPEVPPEYVRLANQFVVPVVEGGEVVALVVLSLNLEVEPGQTEVVHSREPRLRDAFLQVLFAHANAGGFRGSFTDGDNLVLLRSALRETATRELPDLVKDVLITEIVRQDT